jgi:hypothetical protein
LVNMAKNEKKKKKKKKNFGSKSIWWEPSSR